MAIIGSSDDRSGIAGSVLRGTILLLLPFPSSVVIQIQIQNRMRRILSVRLSAASQ